MLKVFLVRCQKEILLELEERSSLSLLLLLSHSVMSDSLRPHGLQLARLLCPSLSSWVCSNLCSLSKWCHPIISSPATLFTLLPLIFPSIRVSSNETTLHIRWPKYWSFNFSISSSSEYSGLISFSIDWFELLAVQGTLKSLLQHHYSKVSVLQHSAFFMVQLSHLYMTTGKTIALLYGSLLTNWCLCFLIQCLGLS